MFSLLSFGTYRNLPEPSIRGQFGSSPDAKGDPATGVSAPVLPSMLYAPTVPSFSFVTYRNLPDGCRVIPFTSAPAVKGEFVISVNAPLAYPILNQAILHPPTPPTHLHLTR